MPRHEIEVVTWGPHRHCERTAADPHLQRFLGGHVLFAAAPGRSVEADYPAPGRHPAHLESILSSCGGVWWSCPGRARGRAGVCGGRAVLEVRWPCAPAMAEVPRGHISSAILECHACLVMGN